VTRYNSPDPDTYNILRFIRVREDLFVGRDIHDKHKDIAAMDGISEAIEATRLSDPMQVDGGFVDFIPGGFIKVTQNSDSLDLPVQEYTQEAREITIRCFQEQSPDHKIMSGKERY
jgi:hypothetical protein